MPVGECYCYRYRKRTWRTMARWQRKQFHRENERRVALGKPPLPKP